jgi:hypothetical protein
MATAHCILHTTLQHNINMYILILMQADPESESEEEKTWVRERWRWNKFLSFLALSNRIFVGEWKNPHLLYLILIHTIACTINNTYCIMRMDGFISGLGCDGDLIWFDGTGQAPHSNFPCSKPKELKMMMMVVLQSSICLLWKVQRRAIYII